MPVLHLDTETFNKADLGAAGTYRYAETAEIMLLTYAWDDDGPVRCIDFTDPDRKVQEVEERLGGLSMGAPIDAVFPDTTFVAHNAMFDRNVLRLGNLKVEIPIERWECTMVQALVHALPPSLAQLGKVLGLPADQQKLAEGRKLIRRFCKPAPRNHKANRYTRETHPELWTRFIEYAKQDVAAMRECRKRMPKWNWQADTIAEWHLDQRINDRGFAVDRALVEAGARAAVMEKKLLASRFSALTGGLSPTQRDKVKQFIADEHLMYLDGTAKHIITPLIDDPDTPPEVREISEIMLMANKTSTAKYAAMRDALSTDGRFRGGIQFAGASRTRRGAGRTFQPHNLPSRGLPKSERIEAYISALKDGAQDLLFDDLMLYGAAALRGIVVAE